MERLKQKVKQKQTQMHWETPKHWRWQMDLSMLKEKPTHLGKPRLMQTHSEKRRLRHVHVEKHEPMERLKQKVKQKQTQMHWETPKHWRWQMDLSMLKEKPTHLAIPRLMQTHSEKLRLMHLHLEKP